MRPNVFGKRTADHDAVYFYPLLGELRLEGGRLVGRCTVSAGFLFLGEVELWSTAELPALYAAAVLADERDGQPGTVRALAAMFCNNQLQP